MAILAQKKGMHVNGDRVMLAASYLLNTVVWAGSFAIWLKVGFAIIAGCTTILSFANAWYTFKKNNRTLWIVVTYNHVVSYIVPKKLRHRKNSISKPKEENQNQ